MYGSLWHARSQLRVSTGILLFHYSTYLASHQPKLVKGLHGDGSTSFGPPWRRKSAHLYTFPSFRSSGRQDCDISLICEAPSTRSHTLTYDNIPWKDSLASKPPPTESWSCPSTRVPPSVIVWPFWKLVPSSFRKPSLKNCHDPEDFSQERQMWCHTPSVALTVVSLWWNKNDTTSHWVPSSTVLMLGSL